jgi:hypothetical protein
MTPLSEVIDRFHCARAEPATVDPLLGFGTYLTDQPHPRLDQELLPSYAEDRAGLRRYVPWLQVRAAAGQTFLGVENDLYCPQAGQDQDKIFRVRFPATGPLMSTAAVERDWRLLLLGFASLLSYSKFEPQALCDFLDDKTVVLEVYWPGHQVMGFVRPAIWKQLPRLLAWALLDRPMTAGLACERCAVRGTCRAYENLLELPAEEATTGMRKAEAAQKLLLAMMLARVSEKAVIERRRVLGRKLAALAVGGQIDVNGLFIIPVVDGTLERYPYGATRLALEQAGLWRDDYGAIALRPLKAALSSFPAPVAQRLAELKIVETKEPVIKEIVDGLSQSVQAPLLRGISI